MVYLGYPSRGCQLCRQKKVKCDEARPQCGRCISRGKTCPGYRDITALVFRSQNHSAEQKMKKLILQHGISSSAPSAGPERKDSEVPRSCSIEPEYYAVNGFYGEYTVRTGYMRILDFLPEMCEKIAIPECLQAALQATALAAMAQRLARRDLLLRSRARFGMALRAVSRLIQNPSTAKDDSVLVSVFLLGMYEAINGESPPGTVWVSHMPGILALLKLRGKTQFQSRIGRGMARLMHYQILIEACLGNCPVPEEMIAWANAVDPRNPISFFTKLALNAAHQCGAIRAMVASGRPLEQGNAIVLESMLNTSAMLESKMRTWSDMFTNNPQWRPLTIPNPSLAVSPADQGAPIEIQIFKNMDTVSILNICRTVRSHLCCDLLALIEYLKQTGKALQPPHLLLKSYCERTTLLMAEDVCSSVPWILGEVNDCGKPMLVPKSQSINGYCLLWPLKQVLMSGGASDWRRNWIRSKFDYIGTALGMKMATQIAREMRIE
ncbi:hypothetical protein K469DRAFT_753652 [Zopfia rhizophila CBS 207.26]|uniref:Zn(2)-C6 fungal-type domain-containing protein n=1 Tax=Zopfia rhizophila CBS 207.26 TaxID=1314779 RepID=A0A6A6DLI6_9PEZI|nr:hypothetical protein K469DRAFT_753652 [Zopfia rhizophila CBS 207.26]